MDDEMQLNEFQKALRDKILKENAEAQCGQEEDEEYDDTDTQRGRYMTFRCQNEYYGIAISYVNEIIGIPMITEVPDTPDYIKGLVNLRGKIVPVIDVRLRFMKEQAPYNDRTCVIVITVNGIMLGLIVDEIAEVVTIDDSNILSPPSVGGTGGNRFIYGLGKVGNDVKLLIDPERLIGDRSLPTV